MRAGTTVALRRGVRSLTTLICLAMIVPSAGCRLSRPGRLTLGGVAIAAGAMLVHSAPACPDGDTGELFDLTAELTCAERVTKLSFGVSFLATGLAFLVLGALPEPGAESPASRGPIAARLHALARDDARDGRCDRALILIASLSKNHPDYHERIVSDPELRPCLP